MTFRNIILMTYSYLAYTNVSKMVVSDKIHMFSKEYVNIRLKKMYDVWGCKFLYLHNIFVWGT